MLVLDKVSDDPDVIAPTSKLGKGWSKISRYVEALPVKLLKTENHSLISPAWIGSNILKRPTAFEPDIIQLHWIGHELLRVEDISKFRPPIVWRLPDMWAFTGGEHYVQECTRYQVGYLKNNRPKGEGGFDLNRWVWNRKLRAWKDISSLTIVTPSSWLAKCASSSYLFKDRRVEVIHNGLDPEQYKPIDKPLARELMKLPQDKQLILFGALGATSDRRKGFHLLQPALQRLSQSAGRGNENIEIVVFGASQPENAIDLGFKSHYLGSLHDDIALALVYSAADVMIVPSIQEGFGQTASESLACGTPVVCFNSTGLKDIVEHQQNGYLARPYESEDLANGIAWVLQDEQRWQALSRRAREKVEQEFTLEIQARRYLKLYQEVLQTSNRKGDKPN
jgi:glycosyltransferase involved in cell wall biosynthesis